MDCCWERREFPSTFAVPDKKTDSSRLAGFARITTIMMIKNRVGAAVISLACIAIAAAGTTDPQYGHWDDLRAQAAADDGLQIAGNLEWDATNQIGYCHLQGYLAFSRASDTTCNVKQAQKIYRELAATYIAIHHFNTGSKYHTISFPLES